MKTQKNITILILALFAFIINVNAQLSGYNHYIDITINASQVSGSGSHSNFPVLIDITDDALKTSANGGYMLNSSGYDIAFSYSENTVTLQHDLENYNEETGNLIAWIKIPTLSATSNTIVRMYFGKSGITTNPSSTNVWSNNYTSVWHLNDDFLDATNNNNDGTDFGTTDISAKVADGQDFNTNTDKIDVGNFSVSGSAITLSAWFKADHFNTNDGRIISKATGQEIVDHYFMLSTISDNGYKLRFRLKTNGTTTTLIASSGNLSAGVWYYANAVYDGSTMKLYLNNTLVGSTSKSGTMNTSSNVDVFIGNNPGATLKPFDGIIDEVRVGNTARSLDWISTEYNNQNSPQTFYSRSGLDGTIFIPEPLNCDEKITVVGKGAQGQPSVTLAIPNISNIDKIRVESVFLGTKPSYITYSSTTQTIVDNTPEYAINGGTNKGSYHAIMQPTSSITITPSNNTSSVHSAVAYIYRSDTTFNSITYIEIFKVYQYRTTSPSYTKVFSIEPGLESRDIVITIPVAELTNDNRKIEITATAGAISKTIVEYRDNLGASLRIIEITLENVPGDITSVIVNIDSPDSDGDSFVAGNILIEVPCDDVQAPIEGGVLPIELLYLNATCGSQSEVIVKWSTASEINNDFFTIYKSLDGSSWTSVTEIKGSGNSNQVNNYEFTDEIPDAHDTYYKLKQTDFNGDSKEFEIIFVYCKFNHKKITFYPNPAKDNINLSFINEHQIEKALEVSVYNSGGQIVHTQEFLSTKNENLHNVILPDHLKPGIYFVHVMLGNEYFYTGQISIIK